MSVRALLLKRHKRRSSTLIVYLQGIGRMREQRLQRHAGNDATVTSGLTGTPLVVANKRRAPIAVLSPTKRTAVIECFNNNGLHKRRAIGGERQKVSTFQVSLLRTSHATGYSL
jgi:hypothetical protein